MPAITPTIYQRLFELTAAFYEAGIQCPPLIALNDWLMKQTLQAPRLATAPAARTVTRTATADKTQATANGFTFEQGVISALEGSPAGVDINDLEAILKPYGMTKMKIVGALGKLNKAKVAHQLANGAWQLRSGVLTQGGVVISGARLDQKRAARTRGTQANDQTGRHAAVA